jgi:hypothetical protein
MGSQTAKNIWRKLSKMNQETLEMIMKNYKQDLTRDKFDKILSLCKLSCDKE